ncbi:MAG: hypothetical protein LBM93_07355 [Oscillospiraceae bacterium]|jgi:hypothetical protein|nr:hypothetical protein [Oscillospiraceae bacterium]
MKGKCLLAILASASILTACGKLGSEKVNITPTIADTFSVNAELSYNDTVSEAIISRLAEGIWQAEFISPNTLSGVTLIFEGEDVTANYKGLSFSVPKNALPYKTALNDFIDIVDNLGGKLQCEKVDGKYVITGTTEQGEYTLKFNQKNAELSEFSMPNIKLEMKLSDYATGNNVAKDEPVETEDAETDEIGEEIDNTEETFSDVGDIPTEVDMDVPEVPKTETTGGEEK